MLIGTQTINDVITSAFAFALLLLIFAGCTRAQDFSQPDLSTDEAVLAELQKIVDAKRAELGGKGGSKLDAKFVCIKRLKESARVIVIGRFAYDYGCRLQGVFVDSRYFEKEDAALSKHALAALGWETAKQAERERLVKLWVEKGYLAFFNVLNERNEDFQNREFQSPQVASRETGETKFTLWIRLPPGRTERGYQLLEYRFAPDGNLLGNSTLENLLQ